MNPLSGLGDDPLKESFGWSFNMIDDMSKLTVFVAG